MYFRVKRTGPYAYLQIVESFRENGQVHQRVLSLLKRLCNLMWAANVTNRITYVTQISYLLFLKMLEEMEVEQAGLVAPPPTKARPAKAETTNGKRPVIFTKAIAGDETVDFAQLRWSTLTSDPNNERMLKTVRDLESAKQAWWFSITEMRSS